MRKNELKNMDKLFENLSKGQTPNFFEMMSALSDVSTIWPDTQQPIPQDAGAVKKSYRVSIYPLNAPALFCPNCG